MQNQSKIKKFFSLKERVIGVKLQVETHYLNEDKGQKKLSEYMINFLDQLARNMNNKSYFSMSLSGLCHAFWMKNFSKCGFRDLFFV